MIACCFIKAMSFRSAPCQFLFFNSLLFPVPVSHCDRATSKTLPPFTLVCVLMEPSVPAFKVPVLDFVLFTKMKDEAQL